MLTSCLSRCSLIFFSCFIIGLAPTYAEPTNDLQAYRDEIKQSETNASQAVLDALQAANADTENSSQQKNNQPGSHSSSASARTPEPHSNIDKAFTPSAANTNNSPNKNPWLKPNPWAQQPPNIWEKNAKVNPYSNAPIPGPSAPANLAIPNPPNIFAHSQPTLNTNKAQPNANF